MFSSKLSILALAVVAAIVIQTYAAPLESESDAKLLAKGFVNYPCSPAGACPDGQYCTGLNTTVNFSTCAAKKCGLAGCAANEECKSGGCLLGACTPCIGCGC